VLEQTLRQLGVEPSARLLDAGCGTSHTLAALTDGLRARGYGFDVSAAAASYWRRRELTMCRASVDAMPFRDGVFDAAVCVDVLETDGVDEARACAELGRVLRDGGYLLLVLPAYRWLFSPEHHRAVHATRRYTRARVAALLGGAPLQVVRLTHLFMSTLPPTALYRFWMRRRQVSAVPQSELRPLPPVLNEALFRVIDLERRLLRRVDLPAGSSILAIAQKRGRSRA
jgi:SAM-dependent methyltransferase